jgi:hypothetical protein
MGHLGFRQETASFPGIHWACPDRVEQFRNTEVVQEPGLFEQNNSESQSTFGLGMGFLA